MQKVVRFFPLALLFTMSIVYSVKIHNKNKYTIFVAPYYLKQNRATRLESPITIMSGEMASIERPERKLMIDREIFFSQKKRRINGKTFRR